MHADVQRTVAEAIDAEHSGRLLEDGLAELDDAGSPGCGRPESPPAG